MKGEARRRSFMGSRMWPRRSYLVLTAVAAGVTVLVLWLLLSISQRKAEAFNPFFRVVELDDSIVDPKVWGKNFPLQYDGYRLTVDMTRTRFGGSEALPRDPTETDPRTRVAESKLEADPRLIRMWSGYAFSKDFREDRGHAYMLTDQTYTERQRVAKQPGTCIHCHASTYVAYRELGEGDLTLGFERLNRMSYSQAREKVTHPIACIDCHSPETMALRVTRPAFMEGIRAYKATLGSPNYDVNEAASHQEMRTYVCAQCHVEYYFRGEEKRLVYPWSRGLKVEDILAYYDAEGFKDWTHAETGAPVLKAQHPEFEMWSQGIHARSGVACSDCHMPYKRVGAMKISDHHIRSPLLNINRACQTCHRVGEAELRARAENIQQVTFEIRERSMEALMALITALKDAKASGRSGDVFTKAQDFQRQAQFRLDFVEAENSMGFHAPQEAARILAGAIDLARQGQILLATER